MAAAAYRAGEKLHSEYYGEDSDYTRKGGVICSEIHYNIYEVQHEQERQNAATRQKKQEIEH